MTDQEAVNYVTQIVKRSGTSFYWGMRLLPRDKREAMYGVYAYCREVDDIADGPLTPGEKLEKLADWRKEIERVFDGSPQTPVGRALSGPVREYELKQSAFNDIIDGMETDSADAVRMPDMGALDRYCDRVACAVGRLSNPIFGIGGDTGEDLARSLGQALQITNILRDLHEDAMINRLYVPRETLTAYGISADLPSVVIKDDRFPEICEMLAARARDNFDEAVGILARCGSASARPPNLMLQNYSRVLEALNRRGWASLKNRVSLPKLQKLWIILRYGLM